MTKIVDISGPIAGVIAAYAHGTSNLPSLTFSGVSRVVGLEPFPPFPGSPGATGHGELVVGEHGEAILSLEGHFGRGGVGDAVSLDLADGSVVGTEFAHVNRVSVVSAKGRQRETTELQLRQWKWTTNRSPVAWVAVLRGADFSRACNLHIEGHGRRSRDSLRLEGNSTWHLVAKGASGEMTCLAIVDAGGHDIASVHLWDDFAALEFLFGTPLRLDLLIGVDENNHAVAAFGPSFGYRFRPGALHAPPLPDERSHAWIAVAFPLLVRRLADAQPNPVVTATCGYVDSTIGHIDGQYLFAQVALEATASRLTPARKPVVKDVAAWEAWVKSVRPHFAQHAVDADAANVLAVKLRDASRPTTSKVVRDTLAGMKLEPPKDGVAEIRGRDGVAHTLSMTGDAPYDIDRDTRRIRIIRVLLAAMVLRHVGYEGRLSGWELDDQRWPVVADWFTVSDDAREASEVSYRVVVPPRPA